MRRNRRMAAIFVAVVLLTGAVTACIARGRLNSLYYDAHAERHVDAMGDGEMDALPTDTPQTEREAPAVVAEPLGEGEPILPDAPAEQGEKDDPLARSEIDAASETDALPEPDASDEPEPKGVEEDPAEIPDEGTADAPEDTPPEGDPDEGDPDEGDPDEGDPDEGDPDEGDPDEDEPDEGDPDEGDPTGDNPGEGDPETDMPSGEDPPVIDVPDQDHESPEPEPEGLPEGEPLPDELQTENEDEPMEPFMALAFQDFIAPVGQPGATLTLIVPVQFVMHGAIYDGDMDSQIEGTIAIARDQAEGFPLSPDVLGLERPLIHAGDNLGYAVFEDLPLLEDAEPGLHEVLLSASWRDAEDEGYAQALAVSVEVENTVSPSDVTLGEFRRPLAHAGSVVTLALPVRYIDAHREVHESNVDEDGDILPYGEGHQAPDYDQSLAEELAELVIAISPNQEADFPLSPEVLSEAHALIAAGENLGYAVFEDLPVREDVAPGEYPLRLAVTWEEVDGAEQSKELLTALSVGAAYQHYGGGVVVYDFTQLRAAIEDDRYSKIYLGYDDLNRGTISYTASGGVLIPAGISRLEIIGTDPLTGRRMTLEDGGKNQEDTLRTTTAGQRVILKNVDVTGKNETGILYSDEKHETHFEFEDVDFVGLCLSDNFGTQSSVTFTNCRVTLTDANGDNARQAAKTGDIHLYGNNAFEQRYRGSGTYAVFYLKSDGIFHVGKGAHVTIYTDTFVMIPDSRLEVAVLIEGEMIAETKGKGGCLSGAATGNSSITIKRGGLLSLYHDNSGAASLFTRQLTVEGSLEIYKTRDATACIGVAAGGSAVFNSPQHVKLTAQEGAIIRCHDAGYADLLIITQAMNRTYPLVNPISKAIWNNFDLSTYSVSVQLRYGEDPINFETTLGNDKKGDALGAIYLTRVNFAPLNTRTLEFGEYRLTIDDPYEGAPYISGDALSGAELTVERYGYVSGAPAGPVIQSAAGVAAQGGRYRTPAGAWPYIPSATYDETCIYVRGNHHGFEAHIYRPCLPGLFYDVPTGLDFGAIEVSDEPRFMDRPVAGFAIEIYDTGVTGPWTLTACMEPMRAADGTGDLEGGVVFVAPDKTVTPLSPDRALLIAAKDPGAPPGLITIEWPEDEGFLLYLPALAGTPGQHYSATIIWTLDTNPNP